MHEKKSTVVIAPVIILGSVWGLSEAALGMGLRTCAAFISGAIMTGVALFFIAAAWFVSRRALGVAALVITAVLFKLFDALLLSLPLKHGAIGNPIFAMVMEVCAFCFIAAVFSRTLQKKTHGQALLGGLAALLAVNLFPLVKYATGVPACLAPGTGYPLALYYVHFAVLTSLVTVPLGFWAGARIKALSLSWAGKEHALRYILAPAAVMLCLALVTFIRLI